MRFHHHRPHAFLPPASLRVERTVPPSVPLVRLCRLPPKSCVSELPEWAATAARKHALRAAPHAGSHFTRRDARGARPGRFFEGWYLRAVLPDGKALAWMFSIEEAVGSTPRQVTAQVLAEDEQLFVRRFGDGDRGWFADAQSLCFGEWGALRGPAGRPRALRRRVFKELVADGFQMTTGGCCGRLEGCEGAGGDVISWDIDMRPLLSWGTRGKPGRCTATWLSHLPLFEPGYQVLMAHGIAAGGSFEFGDRQVDLTGSMLYAEKNWGASFPKRWFWIQANTFRGHADLTLTAVGARRMIADLYEEEIGAVNVHLNGAMYEFSNWNSRRLSWSVAGWGRWETSATARTGHVVSVVAHTADEGTRVLGPSLQGMIYNVRDAAYGTVLLSLTAPDGAVLLNEVRCASAQVEVGGEPWHGVWECSVKPLGQPLRGVINLGAGSRVETSV